MEINEKREQRTINESKSGIEKMEGIAEWKVLRFNPTRKELNQILGKVDSDDESPEIQYIGTSNDGNPYVRLDVWMKDLKTGYISKAKFFIEKKIATSQGGKTMYINAVGKKSYAFKGDTTEETAANLPDWFKKAMTYREAYRGEDRIMGFLRSWLQGIELDVDKGGYRNNILLDMNKLMSGDVSELNSLATSEYASTVVGMSIIEEGKEGKVYSNIYDREFLPGYAIKFFKDGDFEKSKIVSNFIREIKGAYGPKNYTFDMLRPYNPDKLSIPDTVVTDPSGTPRKKEY